LFAFAVMTRRAALIATVVVADLAVAGWNVNAYAPRSLYEPEPIALGLRQALGPHRFYHGMQERLQLRAPSNDIAWLARWNLATLRGISAAMFGIPVVFHLDYDGLAPRRMGILSQVMPRLPWNLRLRVLRAGGVGAFITRDRVEAPDVVEAATLGTGDDRFRVYEFRSPAMARFVSRVHIARGENEALRLFLGAGDDSVVVESPSTHGAQCGNAKVQLLTRASSRSTYAVDAPCAGWVVFAENFYPGWETRVDRNLTAEERADFAFTAVKVAAGRHTIERSYRPKRWLPAAAISI
jgi:hypothetical protein